jgi:hypothetical protein
MQSLADRERVLAVTGLDAVVPVYPRLDEALAAAPGSLGRGQPTAS